MAFDEISGSFAALNIQDNTETQRQLPFFWGPFHANREQVSPDVPAFLFRVCYPGSSGMLSGNWILSQDAAQLDTKLGSQTSMNSRPAAEVADALNRHLWWLPKSLGHSNFVSWTSSFLFALKLVILLQHYRNLSLEQVHIVIISTTQFSELVFVRDAYLIDRYTKSLKEDAISYKDGYQKSLKTLWGMRQMGYYFGEFLSQGALCIEGKSSVVCAAELARRGIFELHPELLEDPTQWSQWVRRKRQQWDREYAKFHSSQGKQLSDLLAPVSRDFQLPMAVSLLSLQARDPADLELLIFLAQFTEHIDLTTLKHNGDLIWKRRRSLSYKSPYDSLDQTMPELQQSLTLVKNVAFLLDAKKDFLFLVSRLENIVKAISKVCATTKQGMEKLILSKSYLRLANSVVIDIERFTRKLLLAVDGQSYTTFFLMTNGSALERLERLKQDSKLSRIQLSKYIRWESSAPT
ncbi:uncharacterized protein PpBr36_11380 [Pyricularia pennisetigena]|uniref:uncharacterized protein n=1 Tax=Pyricularia pennisetigena TaxID=1578925 RepID=UPI00114EFD7A|nr:uncharacterized protein PpBr36_11380 [Pyricularia pennisetigena]TLS20419.1 hypothetical protein PpBr36_11380 [Pyricularia pennisetigena]